MNDLSSKIFTICPQNIHDLSSKYLRSARVCADRRLGKVCRCALAMVRHAGWRPLTLRAKKADFSHVESYHSSCTAYCKSKIWPFFAEAMRACNSTEDLKKKKEFEELNPACISVPDLFFRFSQMCIERIIHPPTAISQSNHERRTKSQPKQNESNPRERKTRRVACRGLGNKHRRKPSPRIVATTIDDDDELCHQFSNGRNAFTSTLSSWIQ